jgi:glucose-1-phosphate thymidylyltransferase
MIDTVGIILAGGSGSRLHPLTLGISKQLLPVYNQPMIYYPLKTLMDMGITKILIIVASELQKTLFLQYLGDGSKFGIRLEYIIQLSPNGLAEAFILGEQFIKNDNVTLILGDNVFLLNNPIMAQPNTIFTYKVKNPSAYGVATLNEYGELDEIIEKPDTYISDNAVVGLYVFDSSAAKLAKKIKPSKRGELEIVDLIKLYKDEDYVSVQEIDGVWFDCGTHDDLLECSEYVRALQKRTTRDIVLRQL